MNYESARMKALKLLALACRGVGGEAANAKRLLDEHCSKHGISLDTLTDSDRSMRSLPVAVKHAAWKPKPDIRLAQLAVQCLRYVKGTDNVGFESLSKSEHPSARKTKRPKYVYSIEAELTLAEWEDWRSCFDHYAPLMWVMQTRLEKQRRQIQAAIKRTVSVFINEHHLFPPDAGSSDSQATPEEIAAYQAAAAAVTGHTWTRPIARLEKPHFMLNDNHYTQP